MNHVVVMSMLECGTKLPPTLSSRLPLEFTIALDCRFQRCTSDHFHRVKKSFSFATIFEVCDDIRMLEPLKYLHLTIKAIANQLIARHRLVENFQRNSPAGILLNGTMDRLVASHEVEEELAELEAKNAEAN